jgi:hypothetical protein
MCKKSVCINHPYVNSTHFFFFLQKRQDEFSTNLSSFRPMLQHELRKTSANAVLVLSLQRCTTVRFVCFRADLPNIRALSRWRQWQVLFARPQTRCVGKGKGLAFRTRFSSHMTMEGKYTAKKRRDVNSPCVFHLLDSEGQCLHLGASIRYTCRIRLSGRSQTHA